MEFINRTNRALECMDKSNMKGLSKEGFKRELKSWQIQFLYFYDKNFKNAFDKLDSSYKIKILKKQMIKIIDNP